MVVCKVPRFCFFGPRGETYSQSPSVTVQVMFKEHIAESDFQQSILKINFNGWKQHLLMALSRKVKYDLGRVYIGHSHGDQVGRKFAFQLSAKSAFYEGKKQFDKHFGKNRNRTSWKLWWENERPLLEWMNQSARSPLYHFRWSSSKLSTSTASVNLWVAEHNHFSPLEPCWGVNGRRRPPIAASPTTSRNYGTCWRACESSTFSVRTPNTCWDPSSAVSRKRRLGVVSVVQRLWLLPHY